jgi:hypothetical protein
MWTRTTERVRVGALVVALMAPGCAAPAPPPTTTPVMPPPERAAEIRSTIIAWLECDECSEGELEAVVKLGQAAAPTLAASLRDGPSPARREQLRRHLEESHARLKDRSRTSAAVYVQRHTENLEGLYRVRAARALSLIGGPAARQALETAQRQPYRDDVKQSIQAALARLGRP